jgi:dolichol kinase
METEILYRQEIYRKLIHLSSLWMCVVMYTLDRSPALFIFAGLAILVFIGEILRRQDTATARFLNRCFGNMLRGAEREKKLRPSGAFYMLVGAFLTVLLFPRVTAVTAFAMMLTGDTAAALIGRRFGRVKLFDKSAEGLAAFIATAYAAALVIYFWIPTEAGYLKIAAAGAVVGGVTELLTKKLHLDDNLSVPLAIGCIMTILS